MALDPELKGFLSALAEGQIKLADGQTKLEATVAHLATATEGALTRLSNRIDDFREAILKGFTNGAERARNLEDDVRSLDERVTRLERGEPRPPPKKR